jgi:hypothetical protein
MDCSAFICTVYLFSVCLNLQMKAPWSLNCWELLIQSHSIMYQKVWYFSNTTVRTLNLALWYLADWLGTPKQWWLIQWNFLGQNGELCLHDIRVTGEQWCTDAGLGVQTPQNSEVLTKLSPIPSRENTSLHNLIRIRVSLICKLSRTPD